MIFFIISGVLKWSRGERKGGEPFLKIAIISSSIISIIIAIMWGRPGATTQVWRSEDSFRSCSSPSSVGSWDQIQVICGISQAQENHSGYNTAHAVSSKSFSG